MGKGHTGIVTGYRDGYITTVEGNTYIDHAARESVVFAHVRKLESINAGFIKYN